MFLYPPWNTHDVRIEARNVKFDVRLARLLTSICLPASPAPAYNADLNPETFLGPVVVYLTSRSKCKTDCVGGAELKLSVGCILRLRQNVSYLDEKVIKLLLLSQVDLRCLLCRRSRLQCRYHLYHTAFCQCIWEKIPLSMVYILWQFYCSWNIKSKPSSSRSEIDCWL